MSTIAQHASARVQGEQRSSSSNSLVVIDAVESPVPKIMHDTAQHNGKVGNFNNRNSHLAGAHTSTGMAPQNPSSTSTNHQQLEQNPSSGFRGRNSNASETRILAGSGGNTSVHGPS